ncbi:hypothetical protein, unknown function [Leishmania infantum JPCM5]|uniref:Uncharacterized protein n=2 Tax=Leishmania infantum TaxID=5671 RepID=A4I842_LEIIN|nr:hypothetical protein, unknown function [Leishmania infantum JPCM5]CAC9525901.1 hypothetical_protein_-_conserved [Leishmania infantum]CAM70982.1 hypothetical protein, unknown function [Leishmania infantum JPCM5]SUZ44797.1 hypothetical_protein_-_conserved [Leishmania infantum]|eukprot:XP_001467911.1 hypothetical protein, unknown function [Leishmania infantum JPCM5]
MGCVNCKRAKRRKDRPTLVEAAARETERERWAAAEQGLAAQDLYTSVHAANSLPLTEREDAMPLPTAPSPLENVQQISAAAAASPGEMENSLGWNSKKKGNSQATAKADNDNTTAALARASRTTAPLESSRETPKGRRGKYQYRRHPEVSSRSDGSLPLPADAVESAKSRDSSSRSTRGSSSSSSSAQAHKSKKGGEEAKKHGSSGSISAAEVCPQESSGDSVAQGHLHSASHSQTAAVGLPIDGLTAAGTTSSTNSHQTRQPKMYHRSSNVSSDLRSNATPPGMETKVYPSADALDDGASDGGSTSHDVPAAIPAPNTSVESGGAAAEASFVSNRAPFEPYSDLEPRDATDYLPPYEWAPRTLPVPSPLRACGPVDMAQWEDGESQFCGLAAAGTTARFQDPMVSVSVEGARTSDSGAAEGNDGASHPLSLHTFYPRLPPAQWASSRSEDCANRPEASAGAFDYPHLPVNAFIQKAHSNEQQPTYQAIYEGDESVHYSPAEYPSNEATPRRTVPPSLVDVHVSEAVGYASPPPVNTAYSFYPSRALLPMHHRHAVPDGGSSKPMAYSHAPPAITTSAPQIYQDGNRSRSGNISVVGIGGGVHPHKPVSYLFDSSMDDWLQSWHAQPPQRQLYSKSVGMW